MTVRPKAAYQANRSGAPWRMPLSIMSKSSRSVNAATPMHSRLKPIASAGLDESRRPRPPGVNSEAIRLTSDSADDADERAEQPAGELRRDPDRAGLVDDQHAGEHADRADDRLDDDPATERSR